VKTIAYEELDAGSTSEPAGCSEEFEHPRIAIHIAKNNPLLPVSLIVIVSISSEDK